MKTTRRENFRVIITPDDPWFIGKKTQEQRERRYMELCEELRKQVVRHVDGFSGASIEADYVHTCAFCGEEWTEDSDEYNGGCCDDDLEANPATLHPEARDDG